MARALVTGATGFVGRTLARALVRDGWAVTAVTRSSSATEQLVSAGIRCVEADQPSALYAIVADTEPDAVFHLAAAQARRHTSADVDTLVEANISVGTHLLQSLVGRDVPVVCAMSYFQYRDGAPATHSLYAATKQAFSSIATYYREREGLDVREVVLYDNYGPSDTRDKLVVALIRAAHTGAAVRTGPLDQPLNLLHVDDVANGLIAAASPDEPQLATVRAPELATVGDVVDAVQRASGGRLIHEIDPARTASYLAAEAGDWPAPRGWSPRWTLEEGIRAVYDADARGITRSATEPDPSPKAH